MQGLTTAQAKQKLKQYGYNRIKGRSSVHPLRLLWEQFTSPIMLVLIGAALISWGVGLLPGQEAHTIDTVLILIIVFLSGISGFIQEYKSEKTVETLKRMANPTVTVIRNGGEKEIDIKYLVPGDLVLLSQGGFIPADAEVVKTEGLLRVNESALTGESQAVSKNKKDEVSRGTYVDAGGGTVRVTATGMDTRIGSIARSLQSMEKAETGFQKEVAVFSKRIIIILSGFIALFTGVAVFKYGLYQSLLTGISLAVGAIPEGLPAVLAIVLSMGARRMAKQNALVKKVAAVESAGATQIICTDKTGTLTRNEMTVRKLYYNGKVMENKKGSVNKKEVEPLIKCGILCNNVRRRTDREGKKKFYGDQTEIALVRFANKLKMFKDDISRNLVRIAENPFNSSRKMMSVVYGKTETSKNNTMYTKGAPEVLADRCDRILENGRTRKMDPKDKKKILKQNKEFASEGLRVLGFAYKKNVDSSGLDKEEKGMCWLGLQAMIDPPHRGVKQALADCYRAGIRVIMITGDNALTAKAIAGEIGFKNLKVISGPELEEMDDKILESELNNGTNIFARTSPFHKPRILSILQKKYSVAMTGDGVNDALAIKRADVGIAMGKQGTDTSKEAADIVLLDDNFATIRNAIREGRRIFDNIRKFLNYLLTSNFAEVLVLFFATVFLTLEEPILLPAHLLWINLLTDGFPALALGADPADKNIMKRQPREKNEPLINKELIWFIVGVGTLLTIVLLATFIYIKNNQGFAMARSALFTGFVLFECARIGSIKAREKTGWFSNLWLIGALLLTFLLQLAVIYTPLNQLFEVVPLGVSEWLILAVGLVVSYWGSIFITKAVIRWVK